MPILGDVLSGLLMLIVAALTAMCIRYSAIPWSGTLILGEVLCVLLALAFFGMAAVVRFGSPRIKAFVFR